MYYKPLNLNKLGKVVNMHIFTLFPIGYSDSNWSSNLYIGTEVLDFHAPQHAKGSAPTSLLFSHCSFALDSVTFKTEQWLHYEYSVSRSVRSQTQQHRTSSNDSSKRLRVPARIQSRSPDRYMRKLSQAHVFIHSFNRYCHAALWPQMKYLVMMLIV